MTSPEALFASVLATEPSRPLVTFYDDASGERSELSARSLGNWVAKTHFLLMDSLGLGVGDQAFVELPAHWISVPVLLGCWSAALSVVDSPADAAVAFVAPAGLERAGGVPNVFAIAPTSAARGFGADVPVDAEDYVVAVRPQADSWASVRFPGGPDDPAIGALSRAEVAELARQRAAELGIAPGARVLSQRAWTSSADWIDTLLAPLAVGGSLVLVTNAAPDRVPVFAKQERASVVLE